VRRNRQVEQLPFLAVIDARSADDKLEVLAIELGDKERKDLWAELFQHLIRRGLDPSAVELGIMDGLPGLAGAFANAATQRRPVHAKRNALKRVGRKERAAFSAGLERVFYAPNEARARAAFVELKGQWARAYPSAVAIIERDLDSLLRFHRFEPKYWPSLRTTNPIERLNGVQTADQSDRDNRRRAECLSSARLRRVDHESRLRVLRAFPAQTLLHT
jgi:putative transposase